MKKTVTIFCVCIMVFASIFAVQAQDKEEYDKDEKGSDQAIAVSQGIPACEEKVRLLEQRIYDLETFIEESGLQLPEASEEEQELLEESEEEQELVEKQDKPKQGFFKGIFKKMFGFFGESEGSQEQLSIIEGQIEEDTVNSSILT